MEFPRVHLQCLVVTPPIHAVGADVGDQGILSGILIGAEAPLKFCGGQPAQPRGINPLGGGVEVTGLIGPQVPIPQGAGEFLPVRRGQQAPPEQTVPDVQPGGQLLGRPHDLGVGLPQRELQEPQRHHVLALLVVGEQGEALHQVDGVSALLDAQRLAVGGRQGPVRLDGVREAAEVGRIQPPFPQAVYHVELEHSPHPISMPLWAGPSA